MNRRLARDSLEDLFTRAKAKDEFEYACALLRIKGMEDAGWDPLEETHQLFNDLLGLAQAPLQIPTKIRLLLLLYCHITEVDSIYEIIYNMLIIVQGDRCQSFPFIDLYGGKTMAGIPPSARRVVDKVKCYATECGEDNTTELLNWMFNDAIRNAFFHSDYTIYNNKFRSKNGKFKISPRMFSEVMPLDQLEDYINRGVTFYSVFMGLWLKHRKSYKENKKVKGRFAADGSWIDVELLADRRKGLHGFKS